MISSLVVSTECDFHAILTRLGKMKRNLTNHGSDALVCIEEAYEKVSEGLKIFNEEHSIEETENVQM